MWQVILLLDNFSNHTISYKPTNIILESFAPNMTPFIQPCDIGIIQTFKAFYRKNFNQCALNQDDAGEQEIYKIDLFQALMMAKKAWIGVKWETIQHCWDHILIQP